MKIKYIASISSFTQRYKTQTQSYSSVLMAYSDWVMGVVVFLPYNSLLCRLLFGVQISDLIAHHQFRGSRLLDFKYRNTYDSILSYGSEAVVPDTAVCVFTTFRQQSRMNLHALWERLEACLSSLLQGRVLTNFIDVSPQNQHLVADSSRAGGRAVTAATLCVNQALHPLSRPTVDKFSSWQLRLTFWVGNYQLVATVQLAVLFLKIA